MALVRGPGLHRANAHHAHAVAVCGGDDLARPGVFLEALHAAGRIQQVGDALHDVWRRLR